MSEKPQFDAINRGVKRASPLGTSLFVGLRALDVFIQYGILAKGLAEPILNRLPIANASSNAAPIVALGLPLKPLIVLGFSAGTAIKQIYWVLFLSQEEMPASNAILIAVFNTLFNSPNSILSLTAAASYFAPRIPHHRRRADGTIAPLPYWHIFFCVRFNSRGGLGNTAQEFQERFTECGEAIYGWIIRFG